MPVNYFLVERNLNDFSEKTKAHEAQLKETHRQLKGVFQNLDQQAAEIRAKVERAAGLLGSLYCAKPINEPLLTVKDAPPAPANYTLVAADGSQIVPSRHRSLQFCLINVGLIKLVKGSGQAPSQEIRSELLDYDRLYSESGALLGEEMVGLFRDKAERTAILDFSLVDELPIITLTDGPLDVFSSSREADTNRKQIQEDVAEVQRQLEAREIINAGYIDKPGSELISRMLSIFQTPDDLLASYEDKQRSLRGVSDANLLKDWVKKPGQRSAVFEIVSKGDKKLGQRQLVCFFFLNVSQGEEAWLTRVEFPAWVSRRPELIDLLHAVVYAETLVLDTHPYPYLLHRAHELAVISKAEADAVEKMLLQKLDADGLSIGKRSSKQYHKDTM